MKSRFITAGFAVSITLMSCVSSVNVEKNMNLEAVSEAEMLKEENERLKRSLEIYSKKEEYFYSVEPEIIPVTRYVVVDEKTIKPEKPEGCEAVRKSMEESLVSLKDYVGGTSYFDYDENTQFPIFTKILSMTTIILNDDEQMEEGSAIFLSDSVRWVVTGDVWETEKGSRQIIMIKPKATGLETNMLVVTNRRLYHFVLYSTNKDYQPMVRFRYPLEKEFITHHTKRVKPSSTVEYFESIDMSKVSFNYKIYIPFLSRKVDWVPEMVYDDGSHTYIILPEVNLQKEFPAVWENGVELTNYEVHPEIHNMIVINKLIEKVTLRIGKKKVVIKKKRGKAKDYSFVAERRKERDERRKKEKEEEMKDVEVHLNTDVGEEKVDSFNFNYKIFLEKNQKQEEWFPVKVYDDGTNLYAGFRDGILDRYPLTFFDGKKALDDWDYRDNMVVFNGIPMNLRVVCDDKYAKIVRFKGSSGIKR